MRYLRAIAAGGVLALAVVTPASAGKLESGHFQESGSDLLEDFCDTPGLDVTNTWENSGSFTVTIRRDGLVHFRDSANGSDAFINPLTDKSYSHTWNFTGNDIGVTDNGDGTLTIIFQGVLQEKWYDGDGTIVLRNAGNFRDEVVVDHNGTPDFPDDDIFISGTNIKPTQHDPFEGRDFCEDFFLFTA